jgi:hypothetical protein
MRSTRSAAGRGPRAPQPASAKASPSAARIPSVAATRGGVANLDDGLLPGAAAALADATTPGASDLDAGRVRDGPAPMRRAGRR